MSRRPVHAPRSCAAERCHTLVKPGELMCRAHWLSLPMNLRKSILFSFRHRWERDYRDYVREAVDMIAEREGVYSGVFETQPRTAGGVAPTHTASPATFVVPPFGGVAR